eukprot:689789-Pyramimonas_sp.AAC.1
MGMRPNWSGFRENANSEAAPPTAKRHTSGRTPTRSASDQPLTVEVARSPLPPVSLLLLHPAQGCSTLENGWLGLGTEGAHPTAGPPPPSRRGGSRDADTPLLAPRVVDS